MSSKLKRFTSGVLVTLTVLSSFTINPVAAGDTNAAVSYLKTQTVNAWVAMALAAAGETVDVSSLKTVSGDKATDYAAAILGLTANNKDPRSYPASDFVKILKDHYNNGQIGETTLVNDDIFGILALISAGVPSSDTVIANSKAFILSHQNNDGGWSFASSGASDTNDTASAIEALLAAGVTKTDAAITKAINYLKSAQNSDGGFPYDPVSQWGTDTDSASTAWVISAVSAIGEDAHSWTKDNHNPIDALLTLQAPSGFFRYQTGIEPDSFTSVSTSYALVALSGKSYPVAKFTANYPTVSFRIAGKDSDLCVGDASAPNALKLVEIVSTTCGFTYRIAQMSFGPYLDQIGNDVAAGAVGWMYNANDVSPDVGAADYQLKDNDSVLWHFNDFNDKLTRISLNEQQIDTGAAVTATVESFDGSTWSALAGATVHFGNSVATTDSNGKTTITSLADGAYKLYATKDGFVRTESESLTVGASVAQEIDLSATLSGSGGGNSSNPGNSSISFTLAQQDGVSGLGFGAVTRGVPMSKNVKIENKGQVNMHIEGSVTGDNLFKSYLTIGNAPWRNYSDTINKNDSRNVSVGLTVPETYSSGGTKTGKLTFWAIQSDH